MTELEQKSAFAEALLLSPSDPFKAAMSVFDGNVGMALQVSCTWPTDPAVVACTKTLLSATGKSIEGLLPDKQRQALDVYSMATDVRIAPEDRLKAHRLYAEIMNHITKDKEAATLINYGVMVVKDHGTPDDWQRSAMEQQRKLTGHGDITIDASTN